ncbi:hypothetical protein KP79_PYT21557 [Mizuhopecten yessoensis]|uniref:G-protein coupled receptors family 1 profile domain-containing protein n=1 Tax=Mizuhopecten yessoensis TaxID=6573 RepID=A0A210R5M5_MIZYE|nr:hypothetical protein KP79_PYT21557 [Mizuhopecten yessoensis]
MEPGVIAMCAAAIVSTACNGLAILVFYRCRLLIFQIRLMFLFMTTHSFIISCLFPVIMILVDGSQHYLLLCGLKCILWAGYRIVPVVLTTVLALDRLISVVWPFLYQRKSTERSILTICLALTSALYVIFGLSINVDKPEADDSCNTYLHMNEFGLHSMIVILSSSIVMTTVSYSVIFYQSERYMAATSSTSETLYNTFRISFLICGFTFALYIISITSCIASVALWRNINNIYLYHVYFICSLLSVTIISINPIFYISRFRESRFHVKKMVCIYKKNTERMESVLRLEHAGIPLPVLPISRSVPALQNSTKRVPGNGAAPNNPISVISVSSLND